MSIAVIKTGGKQYKVSEGDKLKIEKLAAAQSSFNNSRSQQKKAKTPVSPSANHMSRQSQGLTEGGQKSSQKIEFDDILGGKKVIAEVVSAGREKKIKVFKFKSKKRYKRTYGHRQPYSQIEIKEIK